MGALLLLIDKGQTDMLPHVPCRTRLCTVFLQLIELQTVFVVVKWLLYIQGCFHGALPGKPPPQTVIMVYSEVAVSRAVVMVPPQGIPPYLPTISSIRDFSSVNIFLIRKTTGELLHHQLCVGYYKV